MTQATSRMADFVKAVESKFREKLPTGPDGVEVSTHIGDFGVDEIRRYMRKTPHVILAPLGMPKVQTRGANTFVLMNYGAFILTRSTPELDRGLAAMAIAETVLTFLPFESFGCVTRPDAVEADNLYSGDIDKQGLSLWAVRWQQMLELATADDCNYDSLADFLRLHAEYHVGQTDEGIEAGDFVAPQTIELEGPE